MLTARDIMTPRPIYVNENDTLRNAANEMFSADIRHLPVINNREELVGMLSDRDLRELINPLVSSPEERSARLDTRIKELLPEGVVSVSLETEVTDIIEMMLEHRYGAIPVVCEDGTSLCGIVSYIDVLRVAQEMFER